MEAPGALRRCIAASRFAPFDPIELATQFCALGHGVVTVELAQLCVASPSALSERWSLPGR
jgi:hypothetical protein